MRSCRPRSDALSRGLLPATAWIVTVALLAAGCQAPPSRVTLHAPDVHESLTGSPFDPQAARRYGLCCGDELMIRYPTDSTLDQRVRVRSDGMISLPYVGDVPAAGRAPSEVAQELNQRYAGVLKNANVAVIVMEEAGRRVFVGGQVRAPGVLPLQGRQTLSQTLFAAGGTNEFANTEQVLVLRSRADEGTFVLAANLGAILSGTQPDVVLEPYDVIHVPETAITRVNQFVQQYVNAMIPRAVAFPFTTELAVQPVRVISNDSSVSPVQINRQ